MNMDMVRAGIILYGLLPSENLNRNIKLRPVMTWKSVISQIKEVGPGAAIGYGRKYLTTKPTKIATVPVGYADGYPRDLSEEAHMLVCEQCVPILGQICMDQLMLDVSEVTGITKDSVVTILGKEGNKSVSFEDLARWHGSISYELACVVGKRVPRVFFKNGKNIGQTGLCGSGT
jgi:alanine racemase